MKKTIRWYDGDGEEIEMDVDASYEVCWRCEGRGSHCNPAIDGNGITSSEMAELGEEFYEDYMGGAYDVACHECGGKRVILEIDTEAFQRQYPAEFDDWCRHLDEEAAYQSMCEAERRMGA